jgi:gliding motility-associated-like protein
MTPIRLLFCFLILPLVAFAQIPAPRLTCIKRDTLIWQNPTVSCGAIAGYTIYYARNPQGPYAVLRTLPNPNQTRFFFDNVEGGTWYFYIETSAACAGQFPSQSDTLDNNPPTLNPILTASALDNRTVEIRWRRNASSKVVGYIVYKQTTAGLVPLATVNNRDSVRYVDVNATPSVKNEIYQVLAVDQCGTTSLFDQNHRTVLVKAQQSKCDRTIVLNWTRYINPQNPIQRYEIWVGENGRPSALIGSAGGNDTTYTVRNILDRVRYNIHVKAVQSVTNLTARSNDTTVVADVILPVTTLFLKNVTVTDKNQVQLVWRWNTTAKIDSVRILRGGSDSALTAVRGFKPVVPFDDDILFVDTSANPKSGRYFYQIETKDQCGAIRRSNIVATVFLKLRQPANRRNELLWDAYYFASGEVTGYQPSRIVNRILTPIGLPLDTMLRTYTDLAGLDEPSVCYRLGARYEYTLPDGSREDAVSLSNEACAEQSVVMWIPNAFAPSGRNPEFRPLFAFPENIKDFAMTIYDRWGQRIFETTNIVQGWDGRRGSEDLPQGAYTYQLRVTQKTGSVREERGVVVLVR